MFPPGSKYLNSITYDVLQRIAPALCKLPNPVRITGHTSAGSALTDYGYSAWQLSGDRSEVVRRITVDLGVGIARFDSVVGKADSQPLFQDDPFLAAKRRVTILPMYMPPPLPDLTPGR